MAYNQKNNPFKKSYGTSIRDLPDLSYQERSEYRRWKKSEREAGKPGAQNDNTYDAFLNSKKNKKNKLFSGKGWGKIGEWFREFRDKLKNTGGKGTIASTVAERKVYDDFVNKGITGSATISDLRDRGHDTNWTS